MQNFTVLIECRPFCRLDKAPVERLKDAGIEIIDLRGKGLEDPQFDKALPDADAILCGYDLRVTDALLDRAPRVKAIAKLGAGLDIVDQLIDYYQGGKPAHTLNPEVFEVKNG